MRIALPLLVAIPVVLDGCRSADPTTVGVDLPIASRYVWRGVVFNDEPVVQPDAYVSAPLERGTLTGGVWANVDLTDSNGDAGQLFELDPYVDWTFDLGRFSASLGAVHYTYPNFNGLSSSELYALGTTDLGGLTTTLGLFWDVDQAGGVYGNLAVGRGFQLTDALALDLSVSLGWCDGEYAEWLFGSDSSGLADLQAQIGLGYQLNESTSLSAVVLATSVLDDRARDAVVGDDQLVFAIGPSFSF